MRIVILVKQAHGLFDGVLVELGEPSRGSDSLATSLVLAKTREHLGFDLVLAGMSSSSSLTPSAEP